MTAILTALLMCTKSLLSGKICMGKPTRISLNPFTLTMYTWRVKMKMCKTSITAILSNFSQQEADV